MESNESHGNALGLVQIHWGPLVGLPTKSMEPFWKQQGVRGPEKAPPWNPTRLVHTHWLPTREPTRTIFPMGSMRARRAAPPPARGARRGVQSAIPRGLQQYQSHCGLPVHRGSRVRAGAPGETAGVLPMCARVSRESGARPGINKPLHA